MPSHHFARNTTLPEFQSTPPLANAHPAGTRKDALVPGRFRLKPTVAGVELGRDESDASVSTQARRNCRPAPGHGSGIAMLGAGLAGGGGRESPRLRSGLIGRLVGGRLN